jgi:hypothetical protein
MTTKQMLDQIRSIISKCDASEKETYEELVSEAEGWKERLQELEEDDDGELDGGI